MTDSEMLELFEQIAGENDDIISAYYLSSAKDVVLRQAYPFDDTVTEVPEKYKQIQFEIAVYLYNKSGAEGEKMHSEGGIQRRYESGYVPASLLRRIIPCAGLVGD